jgi:hypothetical protein
MPIVLGNTTITGLGVGGLPDGTINADDLASGAVTRAKMGYAGAVLQVLSTTKTNTFTTTSGTFVDVTGLNVSITPTSTSSKILILAMVTGHATVSGCFLNGAIARGGTALGLGDASGSQTRTMSQSNYGQDGGGMFSMHLNFLDSPNTTSATTYSVQVNSSAHSGSTVFINRSQQDSSDTRARGSSTITVMEIAG